VGPNVASSKWSLELWEDVAGTFTDLGNGPGGNAVLVGDTVELQVVGSNLYSYYNGALIFSVANSDLTSGKVGIIASTARGSASAQTTIAGNWVGGNISKTTLSTDLFQRANVSPLDGNWQADGSADAAFAIVSNLATNSTGTATMVNYAENNAVTWANDQWASIVVSAAPTSSDYVGVGVRMGAAYGYLLRCQQVGANNCQVYIVGGGGFSGNTVTLKTNLAVGDALEIDAVGQTITCYQNGVLLFMGISASVTSGKPGMGVISATANSAAISAFAAGGFN
jgi:hypothetical protein